jgi:hypothetical protein
MPHDDPDPQDPMVLVGVELPATADADREMTWAFAEEFARLGFDGRQILALFHEPFYAAAHGALARLGEEEVGAIVDETLSVWGRVRAVDRDPAPLIQIATAPDPPGGGRPASSPQRFESHLAETCEGSGDE